MPYPNSGWRMSMFHHLQRQAERDAAVEGMQEDASSSNPPSSPQSPLGFPIKETYWPELEKIIHEEHRAWERLDLECGICYEKLSVGVPRDGDIQPTPRHIPKIMPCGHIFGNECIVDMIRTQGQRAPEIACPACREKWKHSLCHHINQGRRMPRPYRENIDWIPEVTWQGGRLSTQCTECSIKSSMHSLLGLARVFFNYKDLEHNESLGIIVDAGRIMIKMVDGPNLGHGKGYGKNRSVQLEPGLANIVNEVKKSLKRSVQGNWGGGAGEGDIDFEFVALKPEETQFSHREEIMWDSSSSFTAWDTEYSARSRVH